MRRMISFILTVIMMLSLCACDQGDENFQKPVNFYYTHPSNLITFNSMEGVITHETRESKDFSNDLQGLLNLYLKGPASEELLSPFPADTYIETVTTNENVVLITLSSGFAKLTGLDLTIACACLSMTTLGLTECESVKINVFNELLDGSNSITMTRESLLLLDNASLQDDAA